MPASARAGTVLHVPYTYFPDAAGGTEVYVRNLAQALATFGYASCVAAPGRENLHYDHDGLPIYRFRCDDRQRLELAHGVPDNIAAENFRDIVDALRPAIVHLHARTSAVSERLCELAHDAAARVVFTYHTPTVSCARGTLMLFGNEPCDGVVQRQRCISCALAAYAVPRVLSALAASIPDRLASRLAALGKIAKPAAAIQMSALIGQGCARFHSFMAQVDHVVVPCLWARNVLTRNGVPDTKITLSRQGLADRRVAPGAAAPREEGGPLRIAYFGRIDPAKGADLLARAVATIPQARVTLDLFAILPPGPSAARTQLESWVTRDRRLALRPPVAPDAVEDVMSGYDLIAIPSRGFETGPLVALEAFAAGVPVLGSDLGGITESVRNGVDGILVRPDDVDAWAATILRLADNRTQVRDLRANIRPPRSMDQVAGEMAKIYAKLQQSG